MRPGPSLPRRSDVARFIIRATLLVLAMMAPIISGCADARRPNTIADRKLRQNPRLAEGQRVFMHHCNQCHVGGAAGVGPSLNDKLLPGFLIRFQVRHGLGAMPAFPGRKISNSQLDDLVTYLEYLHDHPTGLVGA